MNEKPYRTVKLYFANKIPVDVWTTVKQRYGYPFEQHFTHLQLPESRIERAWEEMNGYSDPVINKWFLANGSKYGDLVIINTV